MNLKEHKEVNFENGLTVLILQLFVAILVTLRNTESQALADQYIVSLHS